MQRIIVYDHTGTVGYYEGTVLDGPRADLAATKAVTLPVDPDIMDRSAVAGFMRRQWGAGWKFKYPANGQGCPMVLYNVREHPIIHWCALIVPADGGALPIRGHLRLSTDTRQAQVLAGGLHPDVPPAKLETVTARHPDLNGAETGWIIYGRSRFATPMEGYVGLSLYGAVQGALVRWSAVTQTRE